MAEVQGAARNVQMISYIDKHGKMSRIAAEMSKIQGQGIHCNSNYNSSIVQQLGDRQHCRRTITAQSSEDYQLQKISSFGERYKMYFGEIKNNKQLEQLQSAHHHNHMGDITLSDSTATNNTTTGGTVVVTVTNSQSNNSFKLPELKYQLKKTLPMLVTQQSPYDKKQQQQQPQKRQFSSSTNNSQLNQIQQLSQRLLATEIAQTHSSSKQCKETIPITTTKTEQIMEISTPLRKVKQSRLSQSQQLSLSNPLNAYFLHDPKLPKHHQQLQQQQSSSTILGFDASTTSFSASNVIESSQLLEDTTIKRILNDSIKYLKNPPLKPKEQKPQIVREHKRYGSLLRQRTTTSQDFYQDSMGNLTQLSASCKNIDAILPVKLSQKQKQPSLVVTKNISNVTTKQLLHNVQIQQQTQPRHICRNSSLSPSKQSQSTLATCSEEEIQEKNDSNSEEVNQRQLHSSNLVKCPSVQQLQQHILKQPIKPKAFLNEEDQKIYGDRFIQGYTKISLLGKGGFAAVWQAIHDSTGKYVAVKQITAVKGSDSGVREIKANRLLFSVSKDNNTNEDQLYSCGFLRVLEYIQTPQDLFIVSELGRGQSLSKQVYTLKGEFFQGERIYQVQFSTLHTALFQTQSNQILKDLLRQLLKQLCQINSKGLVHGDIKPENILVDIKENNNLVQTVQSVTLIDFGSAYSIHDKGSIPTATPNYLPPEVIEILIEGSKSVKPMANNSTAITNMSQIERLKTITHGYSIDMWCLGAAFVEILSGIPHWLHYKCRVINQNNPHHSAIRYGLFSTRNQDYQKIYKKQQEFCENFFGNIIDIVNNFDSFENAKNFAELLQSMMQFNPKDRISPEDALNHRFFRQ